ncbi:MAG TPA: hypothetical protein VMY42_19215 [Thermoguttaceae bacterium]|nr:hypothetical protein [Thermoguttaceae bacterium]
MRRVNPSLPEDAKVYNFLYPTSDPEYLVQDLLVVRLATGYCVDVGWWPEHDPEGCYEIRVFYEEWDNQQIEPIQTRDIGEVARNVEALASRFNESCVSVPSSGASTIIPAVLTEEWSGTQSDTQGSRWLEFAY